jgi:hypothetical protein
MRWLALCFALTIAIPAALPACAVMRTFTGRRVTGTCQGACDRYVSCKAGATDGDRQRCLSECPDVFSDPESIGAFESLECADAVGYVDGDPPTRASR